jgi:uncharacterized membrane protein YdjX (TVP38/TMEM64 family)
MKVNFLKALIILVFGLCFVFFYASGYAKQITLDNLINSKTILVDFVQNNYPISLVIFALVYVISTVLSFPTASVLTIMSGLLFGYFGLPLTIACATVGSSINFLLVRFVIGNFIQNKYQNKLQLMNNEIAKFGSNYLISLRMFPVVPFFLVNLLAGLTVVKFRDFVWTTALGIIPVSTILVLTGNSFVHVNSIDQIFTPTTYSYLFLIFFASIIPIIYQKYIRH